LDSNGKQILEFDFFFLHRLLRGALISKPDGTTDEMDKYLEQNGHGLMKEGRKNITKNLTRIDGILADIKFEPVANRPGYDTFLRDS
jgi:hypothetical protein